MPDIVVAFLRISSQVAVIVMICNGNFFFCQETTPYKFTLKVVPSETLQAQSSTNRGGVLRVRVKLAIHLCRLGCVFVKAFAYLHPQLLTNMLSTVQLTQSCKLSLLTPISTH